jgi:23S rRNA (uracil1939-C5)-methyltransferase
MKHHSIIDTVSIIDTAYGGSGVGKLKNGKTVFVPYTLTGDEAEIEIISEKSSYSLGRLLRIVTPSPNRTAPDCPYFTVCGGCHFRHISLPYQLEIKAGILKKLTHLSDVEIISGTPEYYRIRATFHTEKGEVGFYKPLSRDLVALSSCKAVTETLFAAVSKFAAKPELQGKFSISAIETPNGILAEVKGEKAPLLSSCHPFKGVKVIQMGKGSVQRIGSGSLIYPLLHGSVTVGCGSFFQANRYLLETFQAAAVRGAEGKILELYAGSGFFTSALLKKGETLAVEADETAAQLGKKSGYPIERGKALEVLKRSPSGNYDTIFLDPPRVGAGKEIMLAAARIEPKRIIYVSCDPMTLARDIAFLKDEWRVAHAVLIDMFPHTYHMESVVSLEKR